jgi:gamma-glutamyltranspeptidase/glutathione hydrolase
VTTRYRGYDVYECPPSGQGLAVLMMLNVLTHHDEVDPVELGQAGDVVMRQHVEHHQHREALSARRAFDEGPVAEDIVARLRDLGGLHTLDDFATAAPEIVTA